MANEPNTPPNPEATPAKPVLLGVRNISQNLQNLAGFKPAVLAPGDAVAVPAKLAQSEHFAKGDLARLVHDEKILELVDMNTGRPLAIDLRPDEHPAKPDVAGSNPVDGVNTMPPIPATAQTAGTPAADPNAPRRR